jgi:PTH1 family peptidyl-tRNA hydrolase
MFSLFSQITSNKIKFAAMKYLIAGLGNIGAEYAHTRHNIGFDVLDYLARKYDFQFEIDRHAMKAELRFKGKTFIFIKPTTYMNLSGKAVSYWLKTEKIPIENLLVITDDLSLPVAKLRLRGKGGAGGHNGLKSIQESLQTDGYPRLRFGVGDNFPKGRQVEFVLGKWDTSEEIEVQKGIERAAEAVMEFALAGIAITMNKYNTAV